MLTLKTVLVLQTPRPQEDDEGVRTRGPSP